jgi:hypothetical protein
MGGEGGVCGVVEDSSGGDIVLAFVYTAAAGLSTVIGGMIPFFFNVNEKQWLGAGLGFAAGVMVYLSFVEVAFSHTRTHARARTHAHAHDARTHSRVPWLTGCVLRFRSSPSRTLTLCASLARKAPPGAPPSASSPVRACVVCCPVCVVCRVTCVLMTLMNACMQEC